MLFNRDFGIDLGSDTIKIYDRKNDSFSEDKNFIAVRRNEGVIAVGQNAYEMLEMTPKNVTVTVPMSSGRISDVVLAEAIIEESLYSGERFLSHRSSLYFSVPTDMTEIERRAYASVSKRGRLKNSRVYLVEKAIADAVSFGISVPETKGSMIVNIGCFNTEMAVIADSRIILNKMVPFAGRSITENIIADIRRKNKLALSRRTATELKKKLSGFGSVKVQGMTVYGSDTDSGLPRDGYVTSATVNRAVSSSLGSLAAEINEFIQRIPPQVLSKIKDEGINLCGGTSRIAGIDRFISESSGIKVNLSPAFESSVILGLKELINNKKDHEYAFLALNR